MWSPSAVRRLIALLAGIGFFGVGLWLIVQGINVTGTLDISSALVSGKLQSSSAGLYIVFLATIIIIFATVGTGTDAHSVKGSAARKESAAERSESSTFHISPLTRRIFWVLAVLLLVMVGVALLIPSLAAGSPIVAMLMLALGVVGIAAFFVFSALLFSLFDS